MMQQKDMPKRMSECGSVSMSPDVNNLMTDDETMLKRGRYSATPSSLMMVTVMDPAIAAMLWSSNWCMY